MKSLVGHVNTSEGKQPANDNGNPEWLSDESIAAFMAEVEAPEASLVG